jgi:outer membrane protein TolC
MMRTSLPRRRALLRTLRATTLGAVLWAGIEARSDEPVAAIPASFQTAIGGIAVEDAPLPPPNSNAATSSVSAEFAPVPGPKEFIDLETVWRIAGARNPNINRARSLVVEARALQRRADLIWLPDLNAGVNYRRHIGVYQSSFGQIRDVDMSSVYLGAGANAVGGNPPAVPGVRLFTSVADAIYEPQAARRLSASRSNDARATNNTMQLESTTAYFELLSAEHRLRAAMQSYADADKIVGTTQSYAKAGQGRSGDAHRAEAEGSLLLIELSRLDEEVGVRAAELARGLNLDPSTRLQTPGGPLHTYDLVDLQVGLPQLVATAQRRRPEVASRSMLIDQSRIRIRQEKTRPFLPTLMLGYSAAGYGGTGNFTPAVAPFASLDNRADFDAWAFWTLRNLGAGNQASVERNEAEAARRGGERRQLLDQVRDEVAEAYAQAYTRRLQLAPALRRLRDAELAYRADYARLQGGEGLPLEVLNSVRLLATARQQLMTIVAADSVAQFRLYAALGLPPNGSDYPDSSAPVETPGTSPPETPSVDTLQNR